MLIRVVWCTTAVAQLSPAELNALRLPPESYLSGVFALVLQRTGDAANAEATPTDVKGPFHLPPEVVPSGFPSRTQACVLDPACGGTACAADPYVGGLRLHLAVDVTSTRSAAQLSGAVVDIWQADPDGTYWRDDEHWRRRMTGDEDEHRYNCRAHGVATNTGRVNFTTLLPGHYVAGSAWRPRHVHLRASAPEHDTLVTQLYFPTDPFLGAADTACSACKSGWPQLVVPLALHRAADVGLGGVTFGLANLSAAATAGATTGAQTGAPTGAPTGALTSAPAGAPATSALRSESSDDDAAVVGAIVALAVLGLVLALLGVASALIVVVWHLCWRTRKASAAAIVLPAKNASTGADDGVELRTSAEGGAESSCTSSTRG